MGMKIRVPASSANLGPGFDCFGVAWQLYNEIEFEKNSSLLIEGCDEKYCNGENLSYRAFCAVLDRAGVEDRGVHIRFGRTDVPVSRGLGSSAALICAGVIAADALYGLNMPKEQLFDIATAIEGHPDNIAPALFGGFTASTMESGVPVTAHFPISDRLHFTVLIPDFELSTALARSVLPESYSRADAVFNVSRAALVIRAMADGDGELLKAAMQDRIHQPYRTRLIDGFEAVQGMAEECGASAMCISGAGSTLLCVSRDESFTEKMSAKMKETFPAWRVIKVVPDNDGARIV